MSKSFTSFEKGPSPPTGDGGTWGIGGMTSCEVGIGIIMPLFSSSLSSCSSSLLPCSSYLPALLSKAASVWLCLILLHANLSIMVDMFFFAQSDFVILRLFCRNGTSLSSSVVCSQSWFVCVWWFSLVGSYFLCIGQLLTVSGQLVSLFVSEWLLVLFLLCLLLPFLLVVYFPPWLAHHRTISAPQSSKYLGAAVGWLPKTMCVGHKYLQSTWRSWFSLWTPVLLLQLVQDVFILLF